jgi:hypothetical protein
MRHYFGMYIALGTVLGTFAPVGACAATRSPNNYQPLAIKTETVAFVPVGEADLASVAFPQESPWAPSYLSEAVQPPTNADCAVPGAAVVDQR